MQREVSKYLYDVAKACDAIRQFTADKTLKDYQSNLLLRSAVERQLMIIGEALNQAVHLQPDLSEQISEVREIVNLRNVIVHGYAVVENETIWGVVTEEIPTLAQRVNELL
ncbi:MAG: DUF86 domain-containing protein [Sedimentisphaerales bacterium]|nr:DUF86 domain-containing protein [Sedimentisphaerales bacterium]